MTEQASNNGTGTIGSDGGLTVKLDTFYGPASLHSYEGNSINVFVGKGNNYSTLVRVRFVQDSKTGEWSREKGPKTTEWNRTVAPKERNRILIVIEELVKKWIADHKLDLELIKVRKLRYRAWNQAQSASYYLAEANKQAQKAQELENAANGLTV